MSANTREKNSKKIVRTVVPRGPNKPKPISEVRQLVSRKEAAAIMGCHPDTVKKLEETRGGPLAVIKLHPNARGVFYRLADVNSIVRATPPAS